MLFTVIAPVPESIANIESVSPLSIAHVRLPVSPVAATVTTEAPLEADSARSAEVSVTVTASSVTAIVNIVLSSLPSALAALMVTVQDCTLS